MTTLVVIRLWLLLERLKRQCCTPHWLLARNFFQKFCYDIGATLQPNFQKENDFKPTCWFTPEVMLKPESFQSFFPKYQSAAHQGLGNSPRVSCVQCQATAASWRAGRGHPPDLQWQNNPVHRSRSKQFPASRRRRKCRHWNFTEPEVSN